MVLPDPMRVISRRHLLVQPDGQGGLRLVNVSEANICFVNEQPLPPGTALPLAAGDQVGLGCYVLEVRLVVEGVQVMPNGAALTVAHGMHSPIPETEGSIAPIPYAAVQNDLANGGLPTALDPHSALCDDDFLRGLLGEVERSNVHEVPDNCAVTRDIDDILDADDASSREDPLLAGRTDGIDLADLSREDDHLLHAAGREADSAALASELVRDPLAHAGDSLLEAISLDPLQMFGAGDAPVTDLLETGQSTGASLGSLGINHQVELHTPFIFPVAANVAKTAESRAANQPATVGGAAGTTLIPDDFQLDELLVPSSSARAGQGAGEGAAGVSIPAVAESLAGASDTPEQVLPDALCGSQVQTRSGAHTCPTSGAATETAGTSAGDEPGRAASRPSPTDTATADPAALYQALLEGLGLDSLPDRTGLDPDLMRTLGKLLGTSVEGAVQLMAARATVKNEVRANVTLIAPERNNPLKFSPNGSVALLYLLGGSAYPGFMGPDESLREAYSDLYRHQLGVVSGMRSALDHVLERFDPETISRMAGNRSLVESLLSLGRKARLWDTYGQYFENTREQAVDRFHDFFGAAFVDGYEESSGVLAGRDRERP